MTALTHTLAQTLARHATQEFIDSCVDAQKSLEEHLYTDHELELVNLLEMEQKDTVIEQCYDCLFTHLVSVCSLHRIGVNPQSAITGLAKFTRALLLMQQWEDAQTIVALCTSDALDVERLAALVSLVGELSELEAFDIIESVDPNFLKGLARIYTEGALGVQDASELEIPQAQVDKLRAYRKHMAAERTLAFRMVKAGYQPGAGAEQYLRRSCDQLSEKDNKDIAFEVVPFLLLARDGWANPLAAWRRHSHLFALESHDVTSVDVEITKLLSQYDLLSTQGVK